MGRNQQWMWPAFLLASGAALCALLIRIWSGYPGNPKGETSLTIALLVVVFAALGRFLIYLWSLWRSGVERPAARIRADVPQAAIDFAPIAVGVALIGLFLFSLSYLKSMITAVVPFWADDFFAATDRAIWVDAEAIALAHGHTLPWFGFFYGLWHAVHLGGILWVLHWFRHDKAPFIISFMLTWAIGMALAYVFSSAGPIFTGEFDPAIAPESVRKPAAILWANYQARGGLIGGGISAFPSMHVAIAAWFWLVLKYRGAPLLGLTYMLAVLYCSVILGWHYVIDGVAGIAIAIAADRLSRLWLRRSKQVPALAAATALPN
jgi:hypothetical protein